MATHMTKILVASFIKIPVVSYEIGANGWTTDGWTEKGWTDRWPDGRSENTKPSLPNVGGGIKIFI